MPTPNPKQHELKPEPEPEPEPEPPSPSPSPRRSERELQKAPLSAIVDALLQSAAACGGEADNWNASIVTTPEGCVLLSLSRDGHPPTHGRPTAARQEDVQEISRLHTALESTKLALEEARSRAAGEQWTPQPSARQQPAPAPAPAPRPALAPARPAARNGGHTPAAERGESYPNMEWLASHPHQEWPRSPPVPTESPLVPGSYSAQLWPRQEAGGGARQDDAGISAGSAARLPAQAARSVPATALELRLEPMLAASPPPAAHRGPSRTASAAAAPETSQGTPGQQSPLHRPRRSAGAGAPSPAHSSPARAAQRPADRARHAAAAHSPSHLPTRPPSAAAPLRSEADAFRSFDTNGDGTIDLAEIKAGLAAIGTHRQPTATALPPPLPSESQCAQRLPLPSFFSGICARWLAVHRRRAMQPAARSPRPAAAPAAASRTRSPQPTAQADRTPARVRKGEDGYSTSFAGAYDPAQTQRSNRRTVAAAGTGGQPPPLPRRLREVLAGQQPPTPGQAAGGKAQAWLQLGAPCPFAQGGSLVIHGACAGSHRAAEPDTTTAMYCMLPAKQGGGDGQPRQCATPTSSLSSATLS